MITLKLLVYNILAISSLPPNTLIVHSFTPSIQTSSTLPLQKTFLKETENGEIEEVQKNKKRICVIGGGASGMFAASIAASTLQQQSMENKEDFQVVVLEGGKKLMTKVEISGGGRCNVMHDTTLPLQQILTSYPRGQRELHGIYAKHFTPQQMRLWFESRGVTLKTESDGRMFPDTDSSQTIIDVIYKEAKKWNVKICLGCKVLKIQKVTNGSNDDDDDEDSTFCKDDLTKSFFIVTNHKDEQYHFDSIILATGSSPTGYDLAKQLGLRTVKPIPSLFTLELKEQVKDEGGVLHGLAGLSVQNSRVTFQYNVPNRKKKQSIIQEGPLLITHHGLSGPAALRLSAFGAHEFYDLKYNCDVSIHWCTAFGSTEEVEDTLWKMKSSISPKRFVSSVCVLGGDTGQQQQQQQPPIPKRLWSALCTSANIEPTTTWGNISKKQIRSLSNSLTNFIVHVSGKGVFKEEFVTAGGVSLKDIDMTTMSCKKTKKKKNKNASTEEDGVDGVFMCGEVVDVDGITGGFNFMNCWGTGFMAGKGAADFVLEKYRQQQQQQQEKDNAPPIP